MLIAVDTNVLIRYVNAAYPEHAVIKRKVDGLIAAGHEICLCNQVIHEYWTVCTRPLANNGMGFDVDRTYDQIQRILTGYNLLADTENLLYIWLDLCKKHQVAGKNAHDARIVACMKLNRVDQLITLNPTDFSRFTEITCITPKEVTEDQNG
ncbi:MAG: type II toxin-antitoxin system VapC family toxin [Chthonomonadales bacterium]